MMMMMMNVNNSHDTVNMLEMIWHETFSIFYSNTSSLSCNNQNCIKLVTEQG